MNEGVFYANSALSVLVGTSVALMVFAAVGFAIGRLASRRVTDKSQVGTIQASMLGMLALMLGFTFGVASSRYDTRRILAVDEANALGTTFMRAQMLPEPYRTNLSNMLRRYTDMRVRTSESFDGLTKLWEMKRESDRLQQAMWREATAMARHHDTPTTALFIASLNESIDLYSSRLAAFLARVPATILWILVGIAAVAVGIVGYGFGLAGQRSWLVMALVSAIIAAVVVMIVDLDRPKSGSIQVSHQSMADLRESLSGFERQPLPTSSSTANKPRRPPT